MIALVLASLLQGACPSVVSVAIISEANDDDRAAATALQGTLSGWDCVRVVHLDAVHSGDATRDVAALDLAKARDVDWLIVAAGDHLLVQARLIDPAMRELLIMPHGPADEVAMDLMAPIGRELTLSRRGGLSVGIVVVDATYKDVRELESLLVALPGVEVAKAGRFKDGRVEFLVRTNAPRTALLEKLHGLKRHGQPPRVLDDRLRRIELTWKANADEAPSGTTSTP